MELEELYHSEHFEFESYDDTGFRLNGRYWQGPHLLTVKTVIAIANPSPLPADLNPYLSAQEGMIFLLGSNQSMTSELRKMWSLWCIEKGFHFEWMPYAPACRTLRVFLEEQRQFSCLLLPSA